MLVITAKDLRAELRTKEAINASLAFALVILLMFSFAFDPQEETTREISGGLLWIVFAFAGTLILNRSFARELPNDCLDALISAPDLRRGAVPRQSACELSCWCWPSNWSRCRCSASSTTCSWTQQFWPVAAGARAGHLGHDRDRHHLQRADREHPAARSHAADADLSDPGSGADGRDAADAAAWSTGKPIGRDTQAWLKMLIGFDVMFTAVSLVLVETVLVG